jgi:hypothetical protein
MADDLHYYKEARKKVELGIAALRAEALKHRAAGRDDPIQSDSTVLFFKAVTSSGYTVLDRTYIEVHTEKRQRKSIKAIKH